MITNNFDYLYTKQLNLDLNEMNQSCENMYRIIRNRFGNGEQHYDGQATMTTKLYTNYNVLMYSFPQFHELFNEIKTMFYEVCDEEHKNYDKFYIQCWLNVYFKGEFIDWHPHWRSEFKVWHGFYCVDVEPDSYTSYRIPIQGEVKELDIISKNNLLVMGKSEDDVHRSSEWHDETRPRVTIAFDIVPRRFVNNYEWTNHWIPI